MTVDTLQITEHIEMQRTAAEGFRSAVPDPRIMGVCELPFELPDMDLLLHQTPREADIGVHEQAESQLKIAWNLINKTTPTVRL